MSRHPTRTLALLAACLTGPLLPAGRADGILPSPAALRGTWTAVAQGSSFETTGRVRLTLNSSGRGTASIRLGDRPNCVVGIGLDSVQPGATLISTGGNPDVSVNLRIGAQPDGTPAIVGVIIDDGVIVPVELAKDAPPAHAAVLAGRYTMAFSDPSSQIWGAGSVTVSKKGAVHFSGRLANGVKLTQGGSLDQAGHWQLFARSGRRALVTGTVGFSDLPESDFTGAATVHIPQLTGKWNVIVQAGQRVNLALVGQRYSPAPGFNASNSAVSIAPQSAGSTLAVGLVAMSASRLVSISDPRVNLTISRETGLLSGNYQDAVGAEKRPLAGVVLQKTHGGAGLALSGQQSIGSFVLTGQEPPPPPPPSTGSNSGSGSSSGSGSGSGSIPGHATNPPTSGGVLIVINPFPNLPPAGDRIPPSDTTGMIRVDTAEPLGATLSVSGGTLSLGRNTEIPSGATAVTRLPETVTGATYSDVPLNGGTLTVHSPTTLGSLGFGSISVAHPTTGVIMNAGQSQLSSGQSTIVSTAPLPSSRLDQVADDATFRIGGGASSTFTGAQVKAMISEARARGEQTVVINGVTVNF